MRLRPLLLREFSAEIVVSIVAKILRSQGSVGKRRLKSLLAPKSDESEKATYRGNTNVLFGARVYQ